MNALYTLSDLMAELSLQITWHMTYYTWKLDVQHVICTQLHPGHVRKSWKQFAVKIVKISNSAFQYKYYFYYYHYSGWRKNIFNIISKYLLINQRTVVGVTDLGNGVGWLGRGFFFHWARIAWRWASADVRLPGWLHDCSTLCQTERLRSCRPWAGRL